MKKYVPLIVSTVILASVSNAQEQAAHASSNETSIQPLSWDPVKEGVTTDSGDDRRGNWWEKAKTLEKAQMLYGKIRDAVGHIVVIKKPFFEQRMHINKELDAFYTQTGFEEGVVYEKLQQFATRVEDVQGKELTQDDERRAAVRIEDTKKNLEQLVQGIQVLHDLEQSLDRALSIMDEQLELCDAYEQKAWERYERIAEILNDETAKLMYVEMEGFMDNIAMIEAYFKNSLTQYFQKTITSVHKQMQLTALLVEQLKTDGIVLVPEVEAVQEEVQQIAEDMPQQIQESAVSWYVRWWQLVSSWITQWYYRFF